MIEHLLGSMSLKRSRGRLYNIHRQAPWFICQPSEYSRGQRRSTTQLQLPSQNPYLNADHAMQTSHSNLGEAITDACAFVRAPGPLCKESPKPPRDCYTTLLEALGQREDETQPSQLHPYHLVCPPPGCSRRLGLSADGDALSCLAKQRKPL
ncbi:hypothetical protein LX36DRAFT_227698 [Colletotrichum falcatum]|nr:hypothetical protein LX36DRAFT_227698 [Colletotrichum falcatum]